MDPELEAFGDAVDRFVERECLPHIDEWERTGNVDRETWRKAGAAGLLLASTPTQYGGGGAPFAYEAIIINRLGRRGANGFLLPTHNLTFAPYVFEFATEAQKTAWGPKLASGEYLGAIAMTEPNTGSDLKAIRTTARRDGDEYVINGQKLFSTGGCNADLLMIACRTENASAEGSSISLIMVETKKAKGLSVGRRLEKIGLAAHDTAELFFDGVRVPLENLLGGKEGLGFRQMMQNLPQERLQIALELLAMIERALELTVQYAKDRTAFQQRIIDFQNTQFVLAECKTEAAVARVFCDHCVQLHAQRQLDASVASMAKLWLTETQGKIVDRCLQVFGGYGYMEEYPIARMYRDARAARIYGGTSEIMKLIIARTL